jgi:lysophospholipase L1-like esterase
MLGRKTVARIVALFCSVAIACLLGEAGLRLVGYSRSYVNPFSSFYEADPVLGFHGKPNFAGRVRKPDFDVWIAHDENGFRRQDNVRATPTDAKNVYVLGDSFVWGWGVAQGREFTDQMNLLMPGYRVHNLGLVATGTVQQYVIFQRYVMPRMHRGDVVLLAFYVNDFADNVGRTMGGSLYAKVENGAIRTVLPDGTAVSGALKNKLKDWSYLFNLVTYCTDRFRQLRAIAAPLNPDVTTAGHSRATMSDDGPEVQVTRFYLAALKNDCEAKQVPLVVAYLPGTAELGEDDPQRMDIPKAEQLACRSAFFRCTEALGIDTVDLLPTLLRGKKSGRCQRVTFRGDPHWNETGHRLAAESLAGWLVARDSARGPLLR